MLVTVVQILVVNWRELRSLRITDQAALLFLQRHLPPKIGDRLRITGDFFLLNIYVVVFNFVRFLIVSILFQSLVYVF